jgi:predicted alpha/beta superfamily hydrolase
MKRKFYFCLFLIFLQQYLIAQLPQVSAGRIERFSNLKSKYIDARNVDVWLPENYDGKNAFAVLYMHDGQMLFDSTTTWNKQEWKVDETISTLIKEGKIKNTIVVGIWNNGKYRHSEYFPAKPLYSINKSLQDSIIEKELQGKVQADLYLKFIVDELKPFIDSTFKTLTNKENTFIAGSSMGGLISMYAICSYPNIFGAAACLSTHWIGSLQRNTPEIPLAFQKYLQEFLPSPNNNKIYFDYGTATLDSFYKPHQVAIDKIMRKKGYSSNNWMTKEFLGEDHSEKAWSKRLAIPLTFILKK